MHINYLEYFICIADCGSISKAANILFLKQSNLSKIIHLLENDFGAPLFIRQSKGVLLTSEGKQVYAWAKKFLKERQELKDSFALGNDYVQKQSGIINLFMVTSINQLVFPNILLPFIQTFPNIEINSYEVSLNEIITSIRETPLSLCLGILNDNFYQTISNESDLFVFLTSQVKFALYAAKDSIFAKSFDSISLSSLYNLPILLYFPAKDAMSPMVELLSDYLNLATIQETNSFPLFHSLLSTGKYLTIGVETSSGMENYKKIKIRDNLNIRTFLSTKKQNIDYTPINLFIKYYFKYKNYPLPQELI